MKPFTVSFLIGAVALMVVASLAWANPAMLPKHDGYPMDKATSPVTGQSLANDPGKPNMSSEKSTLAAAASEDAHIRQHVTNPEDQRLLEKPGAGLLPKVEGPQIKIEPPVKEGTRMK
jgi:hypothetical protein